MPASESGSIKWRFLRMEEPLAARWRGAPTAVQRMSTRICTLMQPNRRAGKAAPAGSPRAVPHLQAAIHPSSTRQQSALQCRQRLPHKHCHRERRPPKMLHSQSTATKRSSSTPRLQIHKGGFICVLTVMVKVDQLPPLLRLERATTMQRDSLFVLTRCSVYGMFKLPLSGR